MAYDNPGGLIAMAVILQTLAMTAVALRIVSRRQNQAGVDIDDWLIIVGLFFATGLFIVQVYGSAKRAFAVPLDITIADPAADGARFNITRNLELCLFVLGVIALTFIKLSVVFLYRRIFSGRGWFGILTWVWIGVLSVWGVAFLIGVLAECGNHLMALFGTPGDYLQRCNHAIRLGWAMVITDAVTDFSTVLLPIPMVMRLHCSWQRKIEIAAVFAIGLFTVGASTAKAAIYIKSSLNLYHTDAIILITQISVWNYVEVQVGILAACAVTVRPIFSRLKHSSSFTSLRNALTGKSSFSTTAKTLRDTDSEKSSSNYSKDNHTLHEPFQPQSKILLERSYAVYQNQGAVEAGQGAK